MFGNWIQQGKALAEKAKAAAENIDQQLNHSVGVENSPGNFRNVTGATEDNDGGLDDVWADDFNDEEIEIEDSKATATSPPTQLVSPNSNVVAGVAPPMPQQQQQPSQHVIADDDGWGGDNVQFEEVDLHMKPNEASEDSTTKALEQSSQPETATVQASVADSDPVPAASDTFQPSSTAEASATVAESGGAQDSPLPDVQQQATTDKEDKDNSNNTTSSVGDAPGSTTPAGSSAVDPLPKTTDEGNSALAARVKTLEEALIQRESQLMAKTDQLTEMQSMYDSEKQVWMNKVQTTKDEAKKKIQRAKERVEAKDAELKAALSAQGSDSAAQTALVAELRKEGEKLALKQSDMEQAVRAAKAEARALAAELDGEIAAKAAALDQVEKLKLELSTTKEDLSFARKGEALAEKLQTELDQVKEESEKKSVNILALDQQGKEFRAQIKELQSELEGAMKGAAVETQREQKKLRKQHEDVMTDFETKLRTVEREAAVREDALRQEVSELRKRWQDAVRRADALSMDVQSSTAPLLRQLESMERQNRVRATAWAELETKLRTEVEDTIISNDKLSKERSDYKAKYCRLERSAKDNEEELKTVKNSLEDKVAQVRSLEEKIAEMERVGAKKKEEWAEVERLANEGVARVRSEMTQTVLESQERYRSQLEAMEKELQEERDKRSQLSQKVREMTDNAAALMAASPHRTPSPGAAAPAPASPERQPVKLRVSEGQEDILNGLGGLGSDDDETEHEDLLVTGDDGHGAARNGGSFAALEELTSRLKVAKVELKTLRKSLAESEKTRERLVAELAESRNAKEKLPLFEAKVQELSVENRHQALEIQCLQEEVAEMQGLYKSQLNAMLMPSSPGGTPAAATRHDSASPPPINGDNNNIASTRDQIVAVPGGGSSAVPAETSPEAGP